MRRSWVRIRNALGLGCLAAGLLVAAGCGRSTGTLTGAVTFEGKNLKGGNISFLSTDGGRSFSAAIAEDGTYKVPNFQSGDYKVCVETESLKPPGGGPPGAAGKLAGGGASGGSGMPTLPKGTKSAPPPGANVPEGYTPSDPNAMKEVHSGKRYVQIPDKYAKPESTDLTYTFKGGEQVWNIELK